jgi:hypothetical protein
MTRRDRVHGWRSTADRRSRLASDPPPPGSLQRMKVPQTACSRADPRRLAGRSFTRARPAARRLAVEKTTVSELTTRGVVGVAYIAPEATDPGSRSGPVH